MKTVYLETSVISYLTGKPSHNVIIAGHQASTIDFWEKINSLFEPIVSALVIKEASEGDPDKSETRTEAISGFKVLDITDKAEALAEILLDKKAIPPANPEDALHIAIAATEGIDCIATWNFKHINNPFTKDRVKEIITGAGYSCPVLASPEELLGDEQ